MSSNLLEGLNPEQLAAVTWPNQSALVLAGAGSGKTRVLTTRIAWLLQTGQATVHSIMAVTFTNKAAKEMKTRLSAMMPLNLKPMWLGTFHGICHRFLRQHHRDANLSASFQILDSSDQLALIKRLLKALDIPEQTITPRSLQGFINAQKEAALRPHQLSGSHPIEEQLIACYAEYETICQREQVVDFAELMLRSYEVLQGNEALRHHYQNRFHHILVDEFQDTNTLQYQWLKLLGAKAALFAVGDDDQSIYRFRGANVGNMNDFIHEFQIEAPVKLEQNYRSVGNILAAANAVITHNSKRLGKNLHTTAEAGDKIRLYHAPNDHLEADFIIDTIQTLIKEGQNPEQIAILYRSNAQSRLLEQALFRCGIPYRIYGGLRFYERQEIKHALAYLRLAVNQADDTALLRIINTPTRGIGSRSIEALQASAAEHNVSLWQAACQQASKNSKIAAFVALIERLSHATQALSLAEAMQTIISESQLEAYYQKQKGDQQERLDNLAELISAATDFRISDTDATLMPEIDPNNPLFHALAFLSNAALESGERQAGADEAAVQLMTVHAAKGLEFNIVFLTGLEEGLFPSEYSLNEQEGEEEERRLMYVAITRAREQLYLSMAQQRLLHGQTHYSIASRFIHEIPPELLQPLSPSPQTAYNPYPSHPIATNDHEFSPSRTDYAGFHIGQNVRHAKFGTGVIIDATAKSESQARLTINFGAQGIKELDTAFAKLEKII